MGLSQMSETALVAANGTNRARLRPRLISIDEGYRYAGVGRSKFYTDFLPKLRTVQVGRRNLIELESLDQLIDELLTGTAT